MDHLKHSTGHKVVIAAMSLWKKIVCAIQAPITTTWRTYRIFDEDYDKTVAEFAKLHSWTAVDLMLWKNAMMYLINNC